MVIGTYGTDEWQTLAWTRAAPSVELASRRPVNVIHVHGATLAEARNTGIKASAARWVCVLDADDELSPGYLDAMEGAIAANGNRDALYTPQVTWLVPGRRKGTQPRFMREVAIADGNWLVIGTVIQRTTFLRTVGFEEWPFYEDWALFARIQKLGVAPVKVFGALYRAHRRQRSRNHPPGGRAAKLAVHDQIRRAVFPELYEADA